VKQNGTAEENTAEKRVKLELNLAFLQNWF